MTVQCSRITNCTGCFVNVLFSPRKFLVLCWMRNKKRVSDLRVTSCWFKKKKVSLMLCIIHAKFVVSITSAVTPACVTNLFMWFKLRIHSLHCPYEVRVHLNLSVKSLSPAQWRKKKKKKKNLPKWLDRKTKREKRRRGRKAEPQPKETRVDGLLF